MFHIRNAKFVLISQGFSTSPVSKDGQSSLFGQSMKPIYSDQSEAAFENYHSEATLAAILSWEPSWPSNRIHRSCLDSFLSSTSSSVWGSPGKKRCHSVIEQISADSGPVLTWVDIVLGQVSAVERRLGILGSTSSTKGSLQKCISIW